MGGGEHEERQGHRDASSSSMEARKGSNIYAEGDDTKAPDALIMKSTSEGRQELQPCGKCGTRWERASCETQHSHRYLVWPSLSHLFVTLSSSLYCFTFSVATTLPFPSRLLWRVSCLSSVWTALLDPDVSPQVNGSTYYFYLKSYPPPRAALFTYEHLHDLHVLSAFLSPLTILFWSCFVFSVYFRAQSRFLSRVPFTCHSNHTPPRP
ncbi:hypothetical protein E2C01_086389 [Portunus trituberculatus]|uniref:Uncharacterized protein n=1 Tax=Portunus trituberculatus TaxID=210409 RepID=A0A5B7J3P2_PORTR|nr:hypothetical protein [Portunus trituberculatus]